jgi:hypothetical protein
LVEEEREAPVVRRIFDLYTAGRHGAVSIAPAARHGAGTGPQRAGLAAGGRAADPAQRGIRRPRPRRGQTFDGNHAGLVDEATFKRAQKLLKERGEDCAQRVGQRSDFLLSGLLRWGRCRRAYVGMSARGNGGLYHYYACSGRQKRGPKACDGDRIPREKLEDAGIYRDGHLIRQAIEQAAESEQDERAALEDRRASVAAEIKRAERAIAATSTRSASRGAWKRWRANWTASRTKTSSSRTSWQQKCRQRPTPPSCTPPPTRWRTRSAKATPNTPRRCSAS